MDVFADASKARVRITKSQQRSIAKMYQDLSKKVAAQAESLKDRTNVSSYLRTQYLQGLQGQISEELRRIGKQQNASIRAGMTEIAEEVVLNNQKFLKALGFNIRGAYSFIPSDVVNEIASGKLYEGRWSLSSAIWKHTAKAERDINMIVSEGVAANKSSYEIAKDLEKYVNPAARKDWKWSKVYPGTSKVIDYNAQRLARTMVSHAYQDSFVRTTIDNPFVDGYMWLASGGDRMCELCAERDGKIFAKDELPLDHPNGMCTFEAVITKSYKEIGKELADWVNGDANPGLDRFAVSLGYTSSTFKGKVS